MLLSRRKFLYRSLTLGTVAVLGDAFWGEKFFIETKKHYLRGASETTDNLIVVQVSDLHLNSLSRQHRLMAQKINAIKPHLVLLTGDAVDKRQNLPLLDSFLELIDRDIAKVAILGNWEYWGKIDLTALRQTYALHNCTLLVNESKQFSFLGKTISVTGVDDLLGGRPDIDKAMHSHTPSDFHIILNHCPQYAETIAARLGAGHQVDFILSGHTHGGQINLLGYVPFVPQGSGKYLKGWYSLPNSHRLYVSKGIGTSIVPARFGARAEMGVFYFIK